MEKTKKVQIESAISLMASTEVLQYISEEELARIKQLDTDPVFVAMSIGYEGESTGQLYKSMGSGEKLKQWFKQLWPLKAVKELVTFLKDKKDIQLYLAHDISNSLRISIGNVINGDKHVTGGITNAVAIGYIHNPVVKQQLAAGKLNACSLEATCIFERTDNELNWIVKQVNDLSGIVLMDRAVNTPGFKDANILGVIAAMSAEEKQERKAVVMAEEKTINLKDVKEYISANDIRPDMLFSVEVLTKVESVKGAFKAETQERIDALVKEKAELEKELIPLKQMNAQQTLKKSIADCELLKDEAKGVVEYLSNIVKVDLKGDASDVETVKKEVQRQLELMTAAGIKVGVKIDPAKTEPAKVPGKVNTEPEVKDDMTDRKINPLIP